MSIGGGPTTIPPVLLLLPDELPALVLPTLPLLLLAPAPPVPAPLVAAAVVLPLELWLLALLVTDAAPPEPPTPLAPLSTLPVVPLPPAPSSRWLRSRRTPQPAVIVAPNPRAASVNRRRMLLPRLRQSALPHKITRGARA
jgi:hypothetical protein